ncbi:MAG: glucosaminidase domain-containing protein [Eubacterium sp.]|nr:glucosaminidase domain-containing protein [Eubacterium sp.]
MKKKLLVLLLAGSVLLGAAPASTSSAALSKDQQKRMDTIYNIVSTEKNWKTYGSLPSVCMAQAYIESGIGIAGRKNNLWGLGAGRSSYSTLKKGVYAYMQCINKSWYTRYGATDTKSWKKQIRAILKGGYCVPAGGYYNEVVRVVKLLDLEKYDKKMFKDHKLAEKRREDAEKEAEQSRIREALAENHEELMGSIQDDLTRLIMGSASSMAGTGNEAAQ